MKTKPDQYASISTPVFSFNSTDACVEFWYHMSGVGAGTLTVSYLSNKDNFKMPVSLWSREGKYNLFFYPIRGTSHLDIFFTSDIL